MPICRRFALTRLIFFLLFCSSLFGASAAFAQSICGSLGLLGKQPKDLTSFLDQYGLGKKAARAECGIEREEFKICTACSDEITTEMMKVIRPMVGARPHRVWHVDWHTARLDAQDVSAKSSASARVIPQKCPLTRLDPGSSSTRSRLASLSASARKKEIEKNRAALIKLGLKDPDEFSELHNSKNGKVRGEDFFYMHRQMLKMINIELTYLGLPCVKPWKDVPELDDKTWPTPSITALKESGHKIPDNDRKRHETAKAALKKMREPEFLSDISLSDLGACLENELHVYLHTNYDQVAKTCANENDLNPRCDDLVTNSGGPLNKHFWKIHGLIDQYVVAWLKANKYDEISEDCSKSKKKCYEWKGKWIGNMPGAAPGAK